MCVRTGRRKEHVFDYDSEELDLSSAAAAPWQSHQVGKSCLLGSLRAHDFCFSTVVKKQPLLYSGTEAFQLATFCLTSPKDQIPSYKLTTGLGFGPSLGQGMTSILNSEVDLLQPFCHRPPVRATLVGLIEGDLNWVEFVWISVWLEKFWDQNSWNLLWFYENGIKRVSGDSKPYQCDPPNSMIP